MGDDSMDCVLNEIMAEMNGMISCGIGLGCSLEMFGDDCLCCASKLCSAEVGGGGDGGGWGENERGSRAKRGEKTLWIS